MLFLFLLLVVVATVIGMVYGTFAAAGWVRQTIREQDAMKSAEAAGTEYPTPVACDPGSLTTTATVPEETKVGSSVSIEVTVVNSGGAPCLMDVGGQSLGAVVTSGNQTMWNSVACPAGPTSRQLLLPAQGTASVTLTWDGRVATDACAPPAPAQAPEAEATESADPAATSTDEAAPADSAAPTDGATSTDGASADPSVSPSPSPTPVVDTYRASAGTYKLRIQVGGQDLTSDQVFVLR